MFHHALPLRFHQEQIVAPFLMKMALKSCSVAGTCSLSQLMRITLCVCKAPLFQMMMLNALLALSRSRQRLIMMIILIQVRLVTLIMAAAELLREIPFLRKQGLLCWKRKRQAPQCSKGAYRLALTEQLD